MTITISNSFTDVGEGDPIQIAAGDSFDYAVSNTFEGTVEVQRSFNAGLTWDKLKSIGDITEPTTGAHKHEGSTTAAWYKFVCTVYTSGTIDVALSDTDDLQETKYNKQGVAQIEYNKNSVKMVQPLNLAAGLELAGMQIATSASITLAAGATDTLTATIQMLDQNGAAVAAVHDIEVFIAGDDAGAAGLSSTSYSGALTATTGAILTALTAKKHILATTDDTGALVLSLVDTGNAATEYFVVKIPLTGQIVVSAASGTNWGA